MFYNQTVNPDISSCYLMLFQDVARYRVLGDDHACGCLFLLHMRLGLEDIAAKRLLRDTVDDSRHVTNLLIDADSLLAMDNHVREVRSAQISSCADENAVVNGK